jgi:hypothetical protein
LHIFVELIGGGFVEYDGVIGLVLDCMITLVFRLPCVLGSGVAIPFPFDHFFFCFLPPDVAAGA